MEEPGLWQRVEEVVQRALELDESRRAEFLENSCRGDEVLRREVESLLAQEKKTLHFIDSSALQVTSKLLAEQVTAETNLVGTTVSHYRMLQKLGGGGMGVVYKAEDTRLHRFVALKFLPERFARDPQRVMRFEREAQAASALNHPNICTIYDIGEHEGNAFIAMEFLEGQTLKHLIGAVPLTTDQILELGTQIADALETAHGNGILHRDVKPTNIFVTKRGQAKLLDFGVAKLRRDLQMEDISQTPPAKVGQDLTEVGVALGTVAYMSPEQVRGEELDARTDLFSFGAVLYEMASALQAFKGNTSGAISAAILHDSPPPLLRLNPSVPPQLEGIVSKALEKDRDFRYKHASEIRTDLQRLKPDSESRRVAATGSDRAPRTARSRAKYYGVGLALALAITSLAVVIQVWRLKRTANFPTPANPVQVVPRSSAEFENASAHRESAWISLTASEAKNHVGETVTVCGEVVSATYATRSDGRPTFINLDKPFPNQIFTIVIWGTDRPKFGNPETAYDGKHICVTGRITTYRGAPETAVSEPSQIKTE